MLKLRIPVLWLFALILIPVPLSAADITLQWDPVGTPGVTYRVHYWLDSGGNTVSADAGSATTYLLRGLGPGVYSFAVTALYAGGLESGYSNIVSAIIEARDAPPREIFNVTHTFPLNSSATISWTTSEPRDSQVEYGLTTAFGVKVNNDSFVTSHEITLRGLTPGTTYQYHVRSWNAAGDVAISADYSFTTPAGVDTTPPAISGVAALSVSSSGATISWTTDELSDSQVEYGTTTAYGSASERNPDMVTSHQVFLAGLMSGTAYHYRVASRDLSGNQAFSTDRIFTTAAAGTNPLVIAEVRASEITGTSATVSWTTSAPADSQVEYGTTPEYGNSTVLNSNQVSTHTVQLADLSAGTTYYFRVRSRDAAGNAAFSDASFRTTSSSQGTPSAALYVPLLLNEATGSDDSARNHSTTLAVANLGTGNVELKFAAYSRDGSPLSVGAPGELPARTAEPRKPLLISDRELYPYSGAAAYIRIDGDIGRVAAYFETLNPDRSVMDGANAASVPVTGFVFADFEESGFSRVMVINPDESPVQLKLELAGGDGNVLETWEGFIPGHGALTGDIYKDLFTHTAPDRLQYVRGSAGSRVVPFQITGKQGRFVRVLDGLGTQSGSTTLYSPQFAAGGDWTTTIAVINLDDAADTVEVKVYGDQGGDPIVKTFPIGARGKLLITQQDLTGYLPPPGLQGYAEISSREARLAGSVTFGDPQGLRNSAALPLAAAAIGTHVFALAVSDAQTDTGIAIVNPGDAPAFVTVEACNGFACTLISPREYTVPAGTCRKRMFKEFLQDDPELVKGNPGLSQFSGFIRIASGETGIASCIAFFARDLSYLSAVPPRVMR